MAHAALDDNVLKDAAINAKMREQAKARRSKLFTLLLNLF